MAMGLYENGLFRDTDGLDMSFGNQEAVLAFLRMVAYKEGFGKIFSDGTKRAARAIGKGPSIITPKETAMATNPYADGCAFIEGKYLPMETIS